MTTLILDAPVITHVNGHHKPPPATAQEARPDPLRGAWMALAVVIGAMAAMIALGGMTLSFRSVWVEMIPAFGAWAALVPIVVDLTVFVFSGVDLVLARLDMSHPLARWMVYAATGGTVYLNYSAGGTSAGRVAHVLMPSIWVVFVELMRHVVRTQVGLATGNRRQAIPLSRWLLSPAPTFLLFRRMVLWRVNSYGDALTRERTRLAALATVRELAGRGWRWRTSPLLRLEIGLGELDAAAVRDRLAPAPVVVPELVSAPQPEPQPTPEPEPIPEPARSFVPSVGGASMRQLYALLCVELGQVEISESLTLRFVGDAAAEAPGSQSLQSLRRRCWVEPVPGLAQLTALGAAVLVSSRGRA